MVGWINSDDIYLPWTLRAVGTIFAIYSRRPRQPGEARSNPLDDVLQPGTAMLAAGYVHVEAGTPGGNWPYFYGVPLEGLTPPQRVELSYELSRNGTRIADVAYLLEHDGRNYQITETTKAVLGYVRKHPGQGVEAIAKGLGTDTKELTLPIRKLVAEKQLKTKGQKRATKYFTR